MKLLRDGLLSKNGDEQNRLVQTADEFSKAPIFIDDSSALSIMQLRAKARRIHSRTPLGFIIVDYLQLLSPTDSKMPREQQVAEASRGLKSLAKELNVPVLVLSQLNRASERKAARRNWPTCVNPARLSKMPTLFLCWPARATPTKNSK